jgi:hypothetical protein
MPDSGHEILLVRHRDPSRLNRSGLALKNLRAASRLVKTGSVLAPESESRKAPSISVSHDHIEMLFASSGSSEVYPRAHVGLLWRFRCLPAGGGAATAPRQPLASSCSGSAARALYLDALRGFFHGTAVEDDLEHTALEPGVDLAVVDPLRQRHAATERAVTALPDEVAPRLLFPVDLVLAGDGQEPVLEGDVRVFLFDSRKLGADHYVPILGEHVHRRCPLRKPPTFPTPATETGHHLVKVAIDLTPRIVKPAERTQQDPLPPSHRGPRSSGSLVPDERPLYTLQYSF